MARNFRIDIGLSSGGTLVGQWDRDFPTTILNCSVQQAAEALLLNDTNRIFQQSGAGTYSARFFVDKITLSGGNPEDGTYTINTLPAGITPLTAIPQLTTNHPGPDTGYLFTITALGSGVGGTTPTRDITIFYTYNTVPSMFLLMTESIGVIVTHPTNYGAIYGLFITGTYEITASQFTLSNPTVPVYVGDKVVITADPDTGNLDHIKTVQLSAIDPITHLLTVLTTIDIDSYYIIWWESDLFEFYLPLELGDFEGFLFIELIGDPGTSFTGSVLVGTLQVLFEDASGIYSLVKNQTHDVLYFREGYTTNTKLIMLPNIQEDEILEDNLFSSLPYPYKILTQQEEPSEDYEVSDFSRIATPQIAIVTKNVEIPSPFIRTAFLP